MKYERLTDKDWHDAKFSKKYTPREVLMRLWQLENAIEAGYWERAFSYECEDCEHLVGHEDYCTKYNKNLIYYDGHLKCDECVREGLLNKKKELEEELRGEV